MKRKILYNLGNSVTHSQEIHLNITYNHLLKIKKNSRINQFFPVQLLTQWHHTLFEKGEKKHARSNMIFKFCAPHIT